MSLVKQLLKQKGGELDGYVEVSRDMLPDTKPGSYVKYMDGNDRLRSAGFLIRIESADKPLQARLLLRSHGVWSLPYMSCNRLFVKECGKANHKVCVELIGRDKLNSIQSKYMAKIAAKIHDARRG